MRVHAVSLDRSDLCKNFLYEHQAPRVRLEPLAGDCSPRKYTRVVVAEAQHNWFADTVLLVEDPNPENARRFIQLAQELREKGIRTPRIFAHDEAGLLLVEDFGTTTYKQVLLDKQESTGWDDVLAALKNLQEQTYLAPGNSALTTYPFMSVSSLLEEVEIFLDWGLSYTGQALSVHEKQHALGLWKQYLNPLAPYLGSQAKDGLVLVHKDFHSENLLKTTAKPGDAPHARVGMIDFQDACWGPPAYDLVSLVEDVRLPFHKERAQKHESTFIAGQKHFSPQHFESTLPIFSLQRATKIFGIFCRLALETQHTIPLDYLPNVLSIMEKGLRHPTASCLWTWFESLALRQRLEAL